MADSTVVIACHDPARPLKRAVASVLRCKAALPLVVAHNLNSAVLRKELGKLAKHCRIIECRDGIHSPAGPFNAGLAAAETEFVAIQGSDDVLEAGAVEAWERLATRFSADMVLTRLHRGSKRRPIHAPPVRPWLCGPADFVRDRLYYRSAPLGLMRTKTLRDLGLKMTARLAVGEDIAFSMRLYSEGRVAVQRRGPGYLIGEDGPARVTMDPRPLENELAHIPDLLSRPWIHQWSPAASEGVAIKTLRIHIFGCLDTRPQSWWDDSAHEGQREKLAGLAREVLDFAPDCVRAFSRADTALLGAILDPTVPTARMLELAQARRHFLSPAALLPAHLGGLTHREGTLRFSTASFLVR